MTAPTRRDFMRQTALGMTGLALMPACDAQGDPALSPDAAVGPDALTPTCGEVTAANIEGPFFTPDSPERTQLNEIGMLGVPFTLTGKVLDRDCEPIAGAVLDFWQADDDGAYDNAGFILRGHQLTAADGSYQLTTIIPGHYLNGASFRPAHIHVKVGASGFGLLTTQLYFEGDEFNDSDGFIVDSLIMSLEDEGGGKRAVFDFVLA